jgi:hypothetical protein
MTYLNKKHKKINFSEGPFSNFLTQKSKKDRNASKKEKRPFLKLSYISLANPKLHEAK